MNFSQRVEISNHLGNVLTTISDKKFGVQNPSDTNYVLYYNAAIITASDYYPFGMKTNRNYYGAAYNNRYGFNGKENDREVKGDGNQYDYGARIYDPRIGKWSSLDPLQSKYPDLSPYSFSANNPINIIDKDGRDTIRFTSGSTVYPTFTEMGGRKIGGNIKSTLSVAIVQATGDDVFEYITVTTVLSATGIKNLPPVKREFYPNNPFSISGITTSPSETGLMGDRDDNDFVSLAKLSSPELLSYLKAHDRLKYGGLGYIKKEAELYEKASRVASTIILIAGVAQGGYGLLRSPGAITQEAKFAQTTFGANFSAEGAFNGAKVDDIARSLKFGSLSVSEVPVQYIMRDGNQLILNTRSAAALSKGGIPRSQWVGVDMTGNPFFEQQLTNQLKRNNLTNSGTLFTRQANTTTVVGPKGVQ